MRTTPLLLLLLLILFFSPLHAQGGNGGFGELESTPMAIGGTFTVSVTGAVGQTYQLYISAAPGFFAIPGVGVVWIDVLSPTFQLFAQGVIPASGSADLSIGVPNDPNIVNLVIFAQAVVSDPGHPSGVALTRALRVDFETPDSFLPLPSLAGPRALGTANLLRDGRVLVTGGGSGSLTAPAGANTTELYQPYLRSWTSGPTMVVARSFHTSAMLPDGRILLMGGADSNGNVTATCEIFDPASNSFGPAASMGTARAAHAATVLLDGRVLVTGGTTTFTSPVGSATPLGDVLNQSVNTGEVYNPATNTWTPVGNTMASKRFGHTQTLLLDGRVACVSGLNGTGSLLGVEIPSWTTTTSHYNPATNTFATGPAIGTARVGHQATRMPNGEVFVSGGLSPTLLFGITTGVTTTNSATRLNAGGTSWSSGGTLPSGALQHGQVLLKNGRVHMSGGAVIALSGTTLTTSAVASCGVRAGGATSVTGTASLPAPRGLHLAVRLYDGSILMAGGADGTTALPTCLLYTPGF
jgi:hypothetical protein